MIITKISTLKFILGMDFAGVVTAVGDGVDNFKVGDAVYGKRGKAGRHMLHAYEIEFNHPITKESIKIRAPYPKDFAQFAQKHA